MSDHEMPGNPAPQGDHAQPEQNHAAFDPAPPPPPPLFVPPPGEPRNPALMREWGAILLAVVVADVCLYSESSGSAGIGLLTIAMPFLLLLGTYQRHLRREFWVLLGLALALGARMIWLGNEGHGILAMLTVAGMVMSLAGFPPFLIEFGLFIPQLMAAAVVNPLRYIGGALRCRSARTNGRDDSHLAIPIGVAALFAFIFVMANPVLRDNVWMWLKEVFAWIPDLLLDSQRWLFWGIVAAVTAGCLRPMIVDEFRALFSNTGQRERIDPDRVAAARDSVFAAARNTLAAVIGLFAMYLVFEAWFFWIRPIPRGFDYSAYAHQGAAWLTAGLALATFTLGLIFRGGLTQHPGVRTLRRMAWVWAAENLLLAAGVFHRTQIYVDYNGMSAMRVVALFGISTVVAGFALVVWMVKRQHSLLWLVRRQLWALFLALVLLALTPVDLIVARHNVRQILAGNPAPCVQIATHSINASGLDELLPLTQLDSDPLIRDGVRALIAREIGEIAGRVESSEGSGWRQTQVAEQRTLARLRPSESRWELYEMNQARRDAAIKAFTDYAAKWYD